MSFDLDTLYGLLPAVYRIRDADEGWPLRALLGVIAEQAAVLEEDLAQLYDDQFIETCAPWVVPYIGDLLGVRGLNELNSADLDPTVQRALSQRAQVANTIAYRRRKGTAAMLEQLAFDATGWRARAVEFFRLLAATHHLNRLPPQPSRSAGRAAARPEPRTVDLRQASALADLDGPFDRLAHTAEVRRIASGRGKYSIPNVGLFLWRLRPYPLTDSPACPAGGDRLRYLFNPLGLSAPLFTLPVAEERIEHLAEPINVPAPIRRHLLAGEELASYCGRDKSFSLSVGGREVGCDDIQVCDLSDDGREGWLAAPPGGKVGVDPELGRIAFAQPPAGAVRVTFHYGFSADLGGGEYEREGTFDTSLPVVAAVSGRASLGAALKAAGGGGAVVIGDSGRYEDRLALQVQAGKRVELRAANGARPALILTAEMPVGGDGEAEVTLSGLLIAGRLRVGAGLARLRLVHCTLVAPSALPLAKGRPAQDILPHPLPSLTVESPDTEVEIERCILVGGLRIADGAGLQVAGDARVRITGSIVDAADPARVAYAGPAGGPGAPLRVEQSTVIGRVHTALLRLASNTIFLADAAAGGAGSPPVHSARLQEGCVRYCYLPWPSRVPRRTRCQPAGAEEQDQARPQFSSLRYGHPAYGQLGPGCPEGVRQGADDGAEMGAFHDLYAPQREANLLERLAEYLRFGLEAGIIYVT